MILARLENKMISLWLQAPARVCSCRGAFFQFLYPISSF